jgi:acyl carrier protein
VSAVEEAIKQFVREFLVDDADAEDPLEGRDIDSLALEQLIDFLEEEFHILLSGEDIVRRNFESTPRLAAVVEARIRATALQQARRDS